MSDYLFFASFPPPERVSRHLLICERAQKPERFFLLLHFSCIYVTCCFLSHRCLHSLGMASVLLLSTMLYVAVSCYSLAFGLLFGLLWSLLSIKSLLRCTACTLGNRSYDNFRSINIRLFTLTRRLFFRNGSFSEPISRCFQHRNSASRR